MLQVAETVKGFTLKSIAEVELLVTLTTTDSVAVLQPPAIGAINEVLAISTPEGPYSPASAPISLGERELLVSPSKSSVTPAIVIPAASAGEPVLPQFVKCN